MSAPRLGRKRSRRKKVPRLGAERKARKAPPRPPPQPGGIEGESDDPAEAGHRIAGQAASDIEWATYRALRSLGWEAGDIRFQVSFWGGRRLSGGQVLDFVLYQGGRPVVVDVRGRHWHGSDSQQRARDWYREQQVQAHASAPPKYVVVWEEVAHSWQRLRGLLLREVGAR